MQLTGRGANDHLRIRRTIFPVLTTENLNISSRYLLCLQSLDYPNTILLSKSCNVLKKVFMEKVRSLASMIILQEGIEIDLLLNGSRKSSFSCHKF